MTWINDTSKVCSNQLLLENMLGRRYGGSPGTNLVACLELAAAMKRGKRTNRRPLATLDPVQG